MPIAIPWRPKFDPLTQEGPMGLTGVGPLDPSIQVPPPAPEIEPPPPPQMVRPEGIGGPQGMPPPPPPPQSFTPDPTVARLGEQLGQQYGQPVAPPPQPTKLRSILGGLVGMTRPGRAQAVGGHSLADLVTFGPSGIRQQDEYNAYLQRLPRPDQVATAQGNLQAQAVGIGRDNATATADIGAANALTTQRGEAAHTEQAQGNVQRAKLVPASAVVAQRLNIPVGTPVEADIAAEITKPPAQQQQRAITSTEVGIIAQGGTVPGYEYITPEIAKAAQAEGAKLAAPHYETNKITGVVTMLGQKEDGSYGVLWQSPKGIAVDRPPASSGAGLTDDAVTQSALRFLQTGVLPALGMSAGGDRQAILNRAAQLGGANANIAGASADYKATAGALTTMSRMRSQILSFEATANKNLDLAAQISKTVPRTGIPLVNRIQQGLQNNFAGDPNLQAFHNSIITAANEYAKVITGQTGGAAVSDAARKEAQTLLSAAQTPQQFAAAVAVMKQEMQNRRDSLNEELDVLRNSFGSPAQGYTPNIVGKGKLTDPAIAQQYLQQANGDKAKARELAKADGWEF